MNTLIQAKLDRLPPRFRSRAERHVRKTLRPWCRQLTKVRVFLGEENAPAAGAACRLVLETARNGSIVTRGRGSDANRALSAALHCARERIRRREERRISRARAQAVRRNLRKAA